LLLLCGFETLQKEEILEASTLVKFRERIGAEGMRHPGHNSPVTFN
jgi:hypothetical protein